MRGIHSPPLSEGKIKTFASRKKEKKYKKVLDE